MRSTCLAIACLLISTAVQAQTPPEAPPARAAVEADPSKIIAQLAGEAFMREAQARLQIERLQAQVEFQRKRADEAEGALATLRAGNAKP